MRPIHINKQVAKTTFQIDNCGNATEATIEITRVAQVPKRFQKPLPYQAQVQVKRKMPLLNLAKRY